MGIERERFKFEVLLSMAARLSGDSGRMGTQSASLVKGFAQSVSPRTDLRTDLSARKGNFPSGALGGWKFVAASAHRLESGDSARQNGKLNGNEAQDRMQKVKHAEREHGS